MKRIIIAYPIKNTAEQFKTLLEENGYYVSHICATGASVLRIAGSLREGIVICASLLRDMSAATLSENLSPDFDIIAITKGETEYYSDGIISLCLPIDISDLLSAVSVLQSSSGSFSRRDSSEREIIDNAKAVLMNMKNLTEQEAHSYLQQQSMITRKNLLDVAGEVILEFKQIGD